MQTLPCYTKVLTLGAFRTENALVGEVAIQEKVDGSQFRFGITDDQRLMFGTHHTTIYPEVADKMFKQAIEYLEPLHLTMLERFVPDTYFFAEYLQKPKHNLLKYDRIPKNHLVLFDVMENGRWLGRKEVEGYARFLDIDFVPEFYRGKITVEELADFFLRESFLGGEKIEGVVIKNYEQNILLGGNIFPLFTKYVQPAYRERHVKEWHPKDNLQTYILSFRDEARWQKAIQHLKEQGILLNDPRDIGNLIMEVHKDLLEEAEADIKDYLFKEFKRQVLGASTKGLPDWYKTKLLENLK